MQSATRGRDLSHKVRPKSIIIKLIERSILILGLILLVWFGYVFYPAFTMRFSGWAGLWDVTTGQKLFKLDRFDRGMVE